MVQAAAAAPMRPVALAETEDSARVPGRAAQPASLDKIPTEMGWGWAQDKTVRMAPVVPARVAVGAGGGGRPPRVLKTTAGMGGGVVGGGGGQAGEGGGGGARGVWRAGGVGGG